MTPTLVRHHGRTETSTRMAPGDRARDWAEIQERMLAPLYEAVYARLEVGSGTRLLSLGCGSGLSLLIAAARGARVTGVDTDLERLALARTRLLPGPDGDAGSPAGQPRLLEGDPSAARPSDGTPYDLITAFTPIGCSSDDGEGLVAALRSAVPLAARGSTVVLTGWGPPERCATAPVLRVAERLCGRDRAPRTGDWRPSGRDDLEELAFRAGLNPDGSGGWPARSDTRTRTARCGGCSPPGSSTRRCGRRTGPRWRRRSPRPCGRTGARTARSGCRTSSAISSAPPERPPRLHHLSDRGGPYLDRRVMPAAR